VDGAHATVGLRIADRPLHRRAYKRATVAGTLHPPLAAAMGRLAGVRPQHTILDPCCGAGTLLAEARLAGAGARLVAVDCDPVALDAAAANAAAANAAAANANAANAAAVGLGIGLLRADAGRLPFTMDSVDRVLVNPPWDRQVPAWGLLGVGGEPHYMCRLWTELTRVLRQDGLLVALIPDHEAVDLSAHGFNVRTAYPVRLSGAAATIVLAGPK
jgi:tRNA (guanine6-N2)-methyltransferase